MRTDTGTRVPSIRTIVAEQLSTNGLAIVGGKPMLAVATMLLTGAMYPFLLAAGDGPRVVPLETALVAAFLGAMGPMRLAGEREMTWRVYAWSLPTSRLTQHLTKVATGWFWILGEVALLMGAMIVVTLAAGGAIGGEYVLEPFRPDSATIAGETPLWLWLTPFGAATLGYLGSSIPSFAGRSKLWLLLAVPVLGGALMVTLVASSALQSSPLDRLVGDEAGLGLATALTGRVETVVAGSGVPAPVEDPRAWLLALMLWCAAAALGVLFAASRYRET